MGCSVGDYIQLLAVPFRLIDKESKKWPGRPGVNMLDHEVMNSQALELEGLFGSAPGTHCSPASDFLYSDLVRSFEQALENGMSPIEALTTILGWVSCEMVRINIENGPAGL
jgi:hypothetical protein